jgi:predicted membrane-bound mannosyltransferase
MVGGGAHSLLMRGWDSVQKMKAEATSRKEALFIALVTGLGAALRFYALGEQPLWLDEATTADYAESGLVGSIFAEPPNPPLFYVIEYFVVRWLGVSEWALRLAPAVFGVLTVPAAWAVARRFFPSRGARRQRLRHWRGSRRF